MLRRFPSDLYESFQGKGNTFSSTVHVLVSAVVKLSRAIRIPSGLELYRGLGSIAEMPDSFHRVDESGRRGYMEWGFMSTTSDREVAKQVSGVPGGLRGRGGDGA